jgi:hypothetical protein
MLSVRALTYEYSARPRRGGNVSDSTRPDIGKAGDGVRQFTDSEGRFWEVHEERAGSFDRRGPSLIFETDNIIRRVRNYPSDWFQWDEAHLEELSKRS